MKKLLILVIILMILMGGYLIITNQFLGSDDVAKNQESYFGKLENRIANNYTIEEFREVIKKTKENYKYPEGADIGEELLKIKEYIPEAKFLIEHRDEIPDQIIETFLKYPENFMYAYRYLDFQEKPSKAELNIIEKAMNIPYFSQVDPRWGYDEMAGSLFGRAGCGQTCMSMVAVSILKDDSLTPLKMRDIAEKGGYFSKGEGTSWSFMSDVPEKLGFHSKQIPVSEAGMAKELEKGRLLILSVKKGDFAYGGHFIVVSGYQDGQFQVLDPNSWYNSEKTWSFKRLAPQIKNIWSFYK